MIFSSIAALLRSEGALDGSREGIMIPLASETPSRAPSRVYTGPLSNTGAGLQPGSRRFQRLIEPTSGSIGRLLAYGAKDAAKIVLVEGAGDALRLAP